jgi:hypothetical protein
VGEGGQWGPCGHDFSFNQIRGLSAL